MEICSIGFLLACCSTVILFHVLPFARLRRLFFGVVNGLFLFSLVPNAQSWIWFAIFIGITFGALVLVRARPRRAVVWTAILLVVTVFAYVKRYSFIPWVVPVELWWPIWKQHQLVTVIGLSYMLFKFIHMLVDEWQGQLNGFTFLSYLNYQLAFFTLVAGPIQRYNDFKRGWEEMDLQPTQSGESLVAWNRILAGMIKMRVLVPLVLAVSHLAGGPVPPGRPSQLWPLLIAFYAYPVELYFNFSGYTDVAIGSAALLGFKLPENFNRPYLARNVLDFWNRWHMSLTRWIRDYVFMASYKVVATRHPRGARYWSYGLLFVALFLTCIWHGTTNAFVVFGLLNGVAVAVNRAYGDVLKAALGRAGVERYLKNRLIQCAAIVLTFHYVCFCHLVFSSTADFSVGDQVSNAVGHVLAIARAITGPDWRAGGVVAVCVLAVILAALWNADTLDLVRSRLALWLVRDAFSTRAVMGAQLLIVVVLFCFDWTLEQEPPPVVYMRF